MDLPNYESLKRTIPRYQHLVSEKIRLVSEKETELAMVDEIKATILAEKGEEWYDEYLKIQKVNERQLGLL